MRTINFLQYNREPKIIESDYFTLSSEFIGELMGDNEYDMTAVIKDVSFTIVALNELKRHYDIEVFAIIEDGRVILTEEDFE